MAGTSDFARAANLQQLLYISGDAVAGVLDTYRQHHAHRPSPPRPRVIDDIKILLKAIQQYEEQVQKIDCTTLGVILTPLPTTRELFQHCLLRGRQLQHQITQNSLRDDTDTRRHLRQLTDAVSKLTVEEDSIAEHAYRMPPVPDPPATSHNTSPRHSRVRSLYLSEENPRSSMYRSFAGDELRSQDANVVQENQVLRSQIEALEASSQAQMDHVRQLHAMISCLNVRFPTHYQATTWEELSAELPRLTHHLESTNDLLKQLERGALSPSLGSTSRPNSSYTEGIRSEPTSPRAYGGITSVLQDLDVNQPVLTTSVNSKAPLRRHVSSAVRNRNTPTDSTRTQTQPAEISQNTQESSTAIPSLRSASPMMSSATSTDLSSFSSSSMPPPASSRTRDQAGPGDTRPGHRRNQSQSVLAGKMVDKGKDKEKRKSGRGFWSS